ncbi:hypothetical protein NPIL_132281 [Nephila pilipes]|uniref:Secreted protein n=1 Tax=Nephila pilipes TaxID=299642 RepID=A0A8X6TX69_NEPPI|nr:hypothetical protein NPIL_132281 [Nephila pilipes]
MVRYIVFCISLKESVLSFWVSWAVLACGRPKPAYPSSHRFHITVVRSQHTPEFKHMHRVPTSQLISPPRLHLPMCLCCPSRFIPGNFFLPGSFQS